MLKSIYFFCCKQVIKIILSIFHPFFKFLNNSFYLKKIGFNPLKIRLIKHQSCQIMIRRIRSILSILIIKKIIKRRETFSQCTHNPITHHLECVYVRMNECFTCNWNNNLENTYYEPYITGSKPPAKQIFAYEQL